MAKQLTTTPAMKAAAKFRSGSDTSLVLLGPRGVGKSTAAAWMVAMAVDQGLAEIAEIGSNIFGIKHYAENAQFMTAAQLSRISRYDDKSMRSIESVRLLVVDDLGVEFNDAKGAFRSLFDGIFNVRYSNCFRTIITSNLTIEEFRSRYGERVIDRIRETGKFIGLDGESLRGADRA